jgi:hypothetical protein
MGKMLTENSPQVCPCWLEYRVRGILVRYLHKVEREIAQDLKMQV